MTLSNSSVSNITFDDIYSGFMIGCVGSGASTVYALNDRFENDTLNVKNSGALVGYDAGKVYGQNILIRNLTYAEANSQGLLLGTLSLAHVWRTRLAHEALCWSEIDSLDSI